MNEEAYLERLVKEVDVQTRIMGNEHPDTWLSMNKLALTYAKFGLNKDAALLYEKVLEARMRTLGPESTLMNMNNLADTYDALDLSAEAKRLHEAFEATFCRDESLLKFRSCHK